MALYLVTGVAGFIGSALARELVKRGERVRGFDNFATGKRENIADTKSLEFHEADLLDLGAMHKMCEGVDFVLHEAALPSVPKSVKDPIATNAACIDGTLNLLVAARDAKVRRVIYAASSSAYGDTPTMPKHEAMQSNPISPYAVAKLACELYMQSFWRVYGMETVSLRYFNIFGPYQDAKSMYSGVLAKFITNMLKGEAPTIHGDGTQSRDFTYIENAVEANFLACKAPAEKVAGKVFNCATGVRFDLNQTVEILRGLTGYKGNVIYGEERTGDIKHSLADVSRAKEAMGYQPLVGFEDGLKRTVEWYKQIAVAAGARS